MRVAFSLRRLALAMPLAIAGPATVEAGKYCRDPLESGTSSGVTQEEALVAAQRRWSSRASALGRGYESWDNADDRALECSTDGQGMFLCRATARPCLPEGLSPESLRKLDM